MKAFKMFNFDCDNANGNFADKHFGPAMIF